MVPKIFGLRLSFLCLFFLVCTHSQWCLYEWFGFGFACVACKATLNYLLVSIIMKLYCHLLVLISQMTVLNLVLGGTIFTEGGHLWGGDIVHYDTVTVHVYTPMWPCQHTNRSVLTCILSAWPPICHGNWLIREGVYFGNCSTLYTSPDASFIGLSKLTDCFSPHFRFSPHQFNFMPTQPHIVFCVRISKLIGETLH